MLSLLLLPLPDSLILVLLFLQQMIDVFIYLCPFTADDIGQLFS